jgi:transposase InsO family protein
LGLTSYYRKFVYQYAKIASPLNSLLRKGNVYKWTPDCQRAFQELKDRLISAPILAYPNFTQPFRLYTDASTSGLGAILAQIQDGIEKVIAYSSRSLSKAERNYGITELEALAMVWSITYYRPYLYGQKFTVLTDHIAIKVLKTTKELDGKLARWALKLQPYDFTIEYKPGKNHTNVDTLSRLYEPATIYTLGTIELHDFRKQQRQDPELRIIIDYLENQTLPLTDQEVDYVLQQSTMHTMMDEILCFLGPPTENQIRKLPARMVVPYTLRQDLLYKYHNDPWSGHLSMKRTYGKLATKYYWPRMYSDTNDWIKNCTDCATKKRYPKLKIGTSTSFIANRPFQIVGSDVMGPFPVTERGYRYILTFTDHFTKWVEGFPIKNANAVTIANHYVNDIVCRFGTPEQFLTDNGSIFTGHVMQEIHRQLEVKSIKTSPYHPQTNGLTERFNKTLVDMLSMYVSAHHKDWDQQLPQVLFAYRTSIHSTTKETPFYLMFGRDARIPYDYDTPEDLKDTYEDIDTYKRQLTSDLQRAHYEVQYYLQHAAQIRERRLQEGRKDHNFNEGDLVWLYTDAVKKGLSKKLAHLWHGPYRIASLPTANNAKLQALNGKYLLHLVNVARLKRYYSPTPPTDTLDLPDENTDDTETYEDTSPATPEQEQEWEVDEILRVRRKNGKTEYRVKWLGYEEPTWEPEENLIHCPEKIRQYHTENNLQCNQCEFHAFTTKGLRTHIRSEHSE